MTIQSGTTRERLIRWGLFAVMCAVASGLFFYDGFVKYPRQNAAQAAENFPTQPEKPPGINARATPENCAKIRPGMGLPEVKDILGEPAYLDRDVAFWVGPAGWIRCKLNGLQVDYPSPKFREGSHPRMDLNWQKVLGALTGLLAIVALTVLIRAAGTHFVLDDQGLTTRRTGLISYDQMKSLDTEEVKRGRVTLYYEAGGEPAELRIDNYRIARFNEIIVGLCERKGFAALPGETESDSDAQKQIPTE